MRSICSIACILLAALGVAVQPAAAKARQIPVAAKAAVSSEDRAACLDGPFDDKVAECTRLIDSRQVSGADLVPARPARADVCAVRGGL